MKRVQDIIQFDHNAENEVVLTRDRLFALVTFEAPVGSPSAEPVYVTMTNDHGKLLPQIYTVTSIQMSSIKKCDESTST